MNGSIFFFHPEVESEREEREIERVSARGRMPAVLLVGFAGVRRTQNIWSNRS